MPLEQRRERHLLHDRVHQRGIPAKRREVGAHRVRREERARVLRHGGDAVAQGLERALLFPVQIHAAAIQPQLPREHAERRRLAAAVAAGERIELARAQRERKTTQHVRRVLCVAKPAVAHAQHGLCLCGGTFRLRQRMLRIAAQICLPLAHGERQVLRCAECGGDARRRGHGRKDRMTTHRGRRLLRRTGGQQPPLLEHDEMIRQRHGFLQPLLRQQDREPELLVELAQRVQKRARRDGVELARRLIQNEHIRPHDHDGGEVEHLLLPAGERVHEPVGNSEIARHLGDAQPHGRFIAAEALEPEGQLVKHLVRHDLIVRMLEHEADAPRLLGKRDVL